MSKANNTRNLLVVFLVLILAFAGIKFFGKRSTKGNFPSRIVELDTSGIDKIVMNPKVEQGGSIEFFLKGDSWRIKKGEIEIPAAEGMVDEMLSQLNSLKPKRLATKNPDSWKEYEVTDSLGSRIRIYKGDEKQADLVVGRISYKQAPPQYGAPQQRPNIIGTSYIRHKDEDEVYTVEGFLSITFNRDFNSYRDQRFLSFTTDSVNQIEFIYPLDTGFILSKSDSIWNINGQEADQGSVKEFLSKNAQKGLKEFNDEFDPSSSPDLRMIISQNGKTPLTIQGYRNGDGSWVLNSSLNPEGFFNTSEDEKRNTFPFLYSYS